MRRLFVATLVAACLASAACASYTDVDTARDEPGSSNKKKNGKASDSKGSANAPDETSGSALDDIPALPDGHVETVPSRCNDVDLGLRGNGEITRTTRQASDFVDVAMKLSGVIISNGGLKVDIEEGASFRVQVETDANLQDAITIGTQDNALVIGSTGSFCTNGLRVRVTMPRFHGAFVGGSADFDVTKRTGPSDVGLEVSGSGSITFRGSADALTIDVSGSGDVLLEKGSAKSTVVEVSGSGSVVGKGFDPGRVTKNVSGSGDVQL